MYARILLLIAFIICISCKHDKKPNDIIPDDIFVNMLVDIHITDAIIKDDRTLKAFYPLPDSLEAYQWIWDKYKYSEAAYDSTLKWYSKRPSLLNKIYQKTLAEISKTENEVDIAYRERSDSLIFESREEIYITPGQLPDKLSLQVPSHGVGRYRLIVRAKMYLNDQSDRPYIKMFTTSDVTNDKQDQQRNYIKDGRLRNYNIITTLRPEKNAPVIIQWLNSSDTASLNKAHLSIESITVEYRP